MSPSSRTTLFACALSLLCVVAPHARTQEPQADAQGCTDSSLFSRIPGCWSEACAQKDFDSLGVYPEAEKPDQFEVTKQKPVEGKIAVVEYSCAANVSPFQI